MALIKGLRGVYDRFKQIGADKQMGAGKAPGTAPTDFTRPEYSRVSPDARIDFSNVANAAAEFTKGLGKRAAAGVVGGLDTVAGVGDLVAQTVPRIQEQGLAKGLRQSLQDFKNAEIQYKTPIGTAIGAASTALFGDEAQASAPQPGQPAQQPGVRNAPVTTPTSAAATTGAVQPPPPPREEAAPGYDQLVNAGLRGVAPGSMNANDVPRGSGLGVPGTVQRTGLRSFTDKDVVAPNTAQRVQQEVRSTQNQQDLARMNQFVAGREAEEAGLRRAQQDQIGDEVERGQIMSTENDVGNAVRMGGLSAGQGSSISAALRADRAERIGKRDKLYSDEATAAATNKAQLEQEGVRAKGNVDVANIAGNAARDAAGLRAQGTLLGQQAKAQVAASKEQREADKDGRAEFERSLLTRLPDMDQDPVTTNFNRQARGKIVEVIDRAGVKANGQVGQEASDLIEVSAKVAKLKERTKVALGPAASHIAEVLLPDFVYKVSKGAPAADIDGMFADLDSLRDAIENGRSEYTYQGEKVTLQPGIFNRMFNDQLDSKDKQKMLSAIRLQQRILEARTQGESAEALADTESYATEDEDDAE